MKSMAHAPQRKADARALRILVNAVPLRYWPLVLGFRATGSTSQHGPRAATNATLPARNLAGRQRLLVADTASRPLPREKPQTSRMPLPRRNTAHQYTSIYQYTCNTCPPSPHCTDSSRPSPKQPTKMTGATNFVASPNHQSDRNVTTSSPLFDTVNTTTYCLCHRKCMGIPLGTRQDARRGKYTYVCVLGQAGPTEIPHNVLAAACVFGVEPWPYRPELL